MEIFNDKKKNVAIANPRTPEASFGAWRVLPIIYTRPNTFSPLIIRVKAKSGTVLVQGGGSLTQGGGFLTQGGGFLVQGGGSLAQGGGSLAQGGGSLAQGGGFLAQGGGFLAQGGGFLAGEKDKLNFLQVLNNKKFN